MARAISLKTAKSSTVKPNGKLTPEDKTLGLEPAIPFYEIEEGDSTE